MEKNLLKTFSSIPIVMKLFDTRIAMVDALFPKGSIGCEIGVFAGDFAQSLVDTVKPAYLIIVDPWDILSPQMCSGDQDGNTVVTCNTITLYEKVVNQFKNTPTVKVIKGFSQNILPTLPDASLDWIYIDGDHSYQGVLRDLLLAESKIKPGGIICGHDFEMNYAKTQHHYDFGVKKAVEEFCSIRGWKLIAKGMDGCVSFALQKM